MVRRDTLTRGLLQGSPNGSRLEPVRFFAPPRIARSRSRSGRRRPREPARSVLLRAIDIGGLVKLTPQPRANGGLLLGRRAGPSRHNRPANLGPSLPSASRLGPRCAQPAPIGCPLARCNWSASYDEDSGAYPTAVHDEGMSGHVTGRHPTPRIEVVHLTRRGPVSGPKMSEPRRSE